MPVRGILSYEHAMNNFLVKENNVAADCIKLLFHVYINAWVVPFKVPDTALCTL